MGVQVNLQGSSPGDALTQMREMQVEAQRRRLEEMQMHDLERQQEREAAIAEASTAKAELETAEARAARQELLTKLDDARKARAGGGDGTPGLTDRLLDQMLGEAQAARQDAQGLREQTQAELREELGRMREDMRQATANPTRERPLDVLAANLSQLKDLRELFRATDPAPTWSGAAGDVNLTIKELEMRQTFELQRERMTMEREERNRQWEEEKAQRNEERQLRMAELQQRRERDHMLGTALNDVMPRIGDAFGGIRAERSAAAQGGGEPADGTETVYCTQEGCGTAMVVGPQDTQVICPKCHHVYAIGR
ncbi:MAG: hypothetical protein ACREN4_07165 [Candidatus Dormibacteria bacterium]